MSQAETIKRLRAQTGAGMLDVKEALDASGGDAEKALDALRKKGLKIAAKKQDRSTNEGLIEAYIHGTGKVGVLLSLACETDFVARNDEFKELAHNIALHIAAAGPQYVSADQVPEDVVAKEKEIFAEQMKGEDKPAEVLEKIIEGKLSKFYEQTCLVNQKFVKDDAKTINDLITEATAKLGEKIEVNEFSRFEL